jgi:hypothetical protein
MTGTFKNTKFQKKLTEGKKFTALQTLRGQMKFLLTW